MAKKTKKDKALIWLDPEGDQIEIVFGQPVGRGEMMNTEDHRVMLRVDEEGRVIGALVMFFSSLMDEGIKELNLSPRAGSPAEMIARKSED